MTSTSRRGHPWTSQEAEQLLLAIQNDTGVAEIAKQHGRTILAIQMQVKKIASEFYFKGNMPFSDIQKLTRLSNYEMEEAFAEQRERIQSRVSKRDKSWSGTPCGYGYSRHQYPMQPTGQAQHGDKVCYHSHGQHGLYTSRFGMSHTDGMRGGRPIGPRAPQ
jgi:hypothetical protein